MSADEPATQTLSSSVPVERPEVPLAVLGRALVQNIEDAIVATDATFRLTVWNGGAERLYGYAASEALGRDARDIAAYAGDASRLELELSETGRSRVELTARRKDGTSIEVELVVVAIRDANGEVTGYLGIHRDVREQKRAEQALRGAQRQTETVLESITDAFVAVDDQWRYTYVNDRALRRLQIRSGQPLTRNDVLGESIWEMFPDAVGTAVYDAYHEAMREQRAVELETYFAPSDEWVEAHAYPSQEGLSIYYRDITDRKTAEQERERRAGQQALVAELGQRALAGADLQSLLEEATDLVARTIGVKGAAISEILPGSDQMVLHAGVGVSREAVGKARVSAGRRSLVGYTMTAGEPVTSGDVLADERFEISKGLARHGPLSAAVVIIEGRRGGPFGALAVFCQAGRVFSAEDINFLQAVANVLASAVERVEAEKAIGEVRETERRRLARDLHDDALQELASALVQAEQARSAAGTPELEGPLGELVPTLKRIGRQLRGAIYDLRLGAEEDRPFPELLEELVEVHRGLVAGCDLRLEVVGGGSPGPLGAQGTELLRIVGEALTNARRHAGARRVRVRLSTADDRLWIEVDDDGRGLDRGQSADATGGRGLMGMWERAVGLGGRLLVSSTPGVGTTVRAEVPLVAPAAEPASNVRIVLVDDHVAVRESLAGAFAREAGFDVVGQAASLSEARALVADVDVAVVDLGLPDGDGAELISELRQLHPRVQALVLTASVDRAEIARAVESGAAGVLHKAVELDQVVDAVRRLRAGETLLPVREVMELVRFAGQTREREQDDRRALALVTPRECEVLQALADGLDTHRIAQRLHISVRTARNHIASILAKLGAHSQLQALVFALRYDMVQVHQPSAGGWIRRSGLGGPLGDLPANPERDRARAAKADLSIGPRSRAATRSSSSSSTSPPY
jgi:PAS domain S-box-containing protein